MKLAKRLVSGLLVWLTLSCASAPPPSAKATSAQATSATERASADSALPKTPAEALAMKKAGRQWEDCAIRVYYNELVSSIAANNQTLQSEGKSAEERAHAAYDIRHNARLTARAMMASDAAVQALRDRDQEKYGNPEGPTFDDLVKKNQSKGLAGNDVFEEIIKSSQRTDESVNKDCNIAK